MNTRVAVHQPNYLPWLGFFAKMWHSDVLIFLRDVQMPQGRSYVSRTKVFKPPLGDQWLTVPVHKGSGQQIAEVVTADLDWPQKHLRTLMHVYGKAQHSSLVLELLASHYAERSQRLADFNEVLIREIAGVLGWEGRFARSSDYPTESRGGQRLIDLTHAVGGDTYVSGAGGDNYQDHGDFRRAGLEIDVRSYRPVPYPQFGGEFVGGLSIVDALCHVGADVPSLLVYG